MYSGTLFSKWATKCFQSLIIGLDYLLTDISAEIFVIYSVSIANDTVKDAEFAKTFRIYMELNGTSRYFNYYKRKSRSSLVNNHG